MPGFNYTAIDRNGKRVRSSLDASSIETAKSSLRGAGYTILDIKEQTTLNRDIEIPFLGKPKAKDMAVFCRQFVSILRAGVSVASVLAMLGQQTSNKKLRAAIREMQADVEKGYLSRANALEKECDGKMDEVIRAMETLIRDNNGDLTLVDTVVYTYANEKSLKKSWYMTKLEQKGLL